MDRVNKVVVQVVVDGPAASIMLIDTVDTIVDSSVTVLRIVAAGCVSSTVTVESKVSVAGGRVCAGAVMVFVTSTDCTIVVSAACCALEDEGTEPELPSMLTTE